MLQSLIVICEKYAKQSAIEFNFSKCNFIVFGSNKLNNTAFILNNQPTKFHTLLIPNTKDLKYFGFQMILY
jgi:hypothetical protein